MVFSFERQVSLRMKFIADVMLGKLARYLRILGYDTLYSSQMDEEELIRNAIGQKRMLLTRRTKIKRREDIKDILFITQDNPKKQLREVYERLHIMPVAGSLFTRCLSCNEILVDMSKEKAEGKVPEHILNAHDSFSFCPHCNRLYWPGTHHERMLQQTKNQARNIL